MGFADAANRVTEVLRGVLCRQPDTLGAQFETLDAFRVCLREKLWDAAWPPTDGGQYIRSEPFGHALLDIARRLAEKYRHMDFTDAVAQVFEWFEQRLNREPDFLSTGRFPTANAFRAYLRQALWNAARAAERKRSNRRRIEALAAEQPITSGELAIDERDQLLDLVEQLHEPHKSIFTKIFFDETEPQAVASIFDRTEEDVIRIYVEAVDEIGRRQKSQFGAH
jgi:DNA-directed RNA polymerase specialized sigma24 family protein